MPSRTRVCASSDCAVVVHNGVFSQTPMQDLQDLQENESDLQDSKRPKWVPRTSMIQYRIDLQDLR